MKTRKYLTLLLLLLIGGTGSMTFFYWTANSKAVATTLEPTSPKPTAVVLPLSELPCPIEAACPNDFASQKVVHKFASLQAEVDFLNQANALPFENKFHDGVTVAKPSKVFHQVTQQGWMLKMPFSSFLTTPTYADGVLYTSGGFNARDFYAIDGATGKPRWAVDLSDDGASSALVLDSMVIFNTESCTIFALDRFTGRQVWAKWIGDPLLTHPVSDGKLVFTAYPAYANTTQEGKSLEFTRIKPSHAFAAMDVYDGAVVWQRWLDGDVMTTPILSGDDIYLTTFSGTMYRLAKSDGKILSAAKLQGTSLPTIVGDKVYTTQRQVIKGKVNEAIVELRKSDLKKLRTLSLRPAPYLDYKVQRQSKYKQVCNNMDMMNGFWSVPEVSGWRKASQVIGQSNVSSLQNFVGSTVVVDGERLYSTMGNVLLCIDLATDSTLWQHEFAGDMDAEGGHSATMPMVLDQYLVTVTLDGEVLILNKLDGHQVRAYATHMQVRNQPIVIGGKVFVTSTDGQLTCIDTKNRKLDGWHMFLKNNGHDCGVN